MPLAFVTGSTGFLGAHVARKLVEKGWRVVSLVRRPSAGNPAGEHVTGDVTDYASVVRGLPHDCDAVFHIAADISHWHADSARQNRTNVEGTRNVARAALAAGAKRFVHCSSDAVWGLQTPVLREDVPRLGALEPINYQRSKFWAEEEVRCAIDQGLDAVIVNPTNIVGPGDVQGWSLFPVGIYTGQTRSGPPGSGAFVHVEDVADAMINAAYRGRSGHCYLLGGVNASYLEFARLCAAKFGMPFPAEPRGADSIIGEARALEDEASVSGKRPWLTVDTALVLCAKVEVDSSKAVRELEFRIRPLETLVELTLAWLSEAGLLPPGPMKDAHQP